MSNSEEAEKTEANFITYNQVLSCLLTPCSRVLLEKLNSSQLVNKLNGSQLVNKFPTFY